MERLTPCHLSSSAGLPPLLCAKKVQEDRYAPFPCSGLHLALILCKSGAPSMHNPLGVGPRAREGLIIDTLVWKYRVCDTPCPNPSPHVSREILEIDDPSVMSSRPQIHIVGIPLHSHSSPSRVIVILAEGSSTCNLTIKLK